MCDLSLKSREYNSSLFSFVFDLKHKYDYFAYFVTITAIQYLESGWPNSQYFVESELPLIIHFRRLEINALVVVVFI